MEKIKSLIRIFFSRDFFWFIVIGGINTLNGIVFSYLYSLFLDANFSFVLGYITGLLISYLLNSFITFKERLHFKKFVKFCISYIPNFIIQNLVVILIYNILGWHKLIAYALAAIIGIPVTFLLMKFFAFSKKTSGRVRPLEKDGDSFSEPYYLSYESRYRTVYAAGATHWGHQPDDPVLGSMLEDWVRENGLEGKNVLETACGEGAAGVVLSRLGCLYRGLDVAPSAVEKAREALRTCPEASVIEHDMVRQPVEGSYDAAIDVMGLHMLVTDLDRECYLKHLYDALKPGAPVILIRQAYSPDAFEGRVETFTQWQSLTGEDYVTASERSAYGACGAIKVMLPMLPARPKSRQGYLEEMQQAGFIVDAFTEMEESVQCLHTASIWMHKPC